MNNFVFSTGGDWDSTTLYNNSVEYLASQLYVELHAGRDAYGDPNLGGVFDGGEITATVHPQNNPNSEEGIFPGRLQMRFPNHEIVIENTHPGFAFEFTRIFFDNRDVSNNIVDLLVNIDAVQNVVQAYITLYKAHWLTSDEVATYTIL